MNITIQIIIDILQQQSMIYSGFFSSNIQVLPTSTFPQYLLTMIIA